MVLSSNDKPRKGEKGMSDAMRRGQDVESLRRQSGNTQHAGPNMRRLAEETDVPQVVTVGHEFAQAMMKGRMDLNLKQQELALRINEKLTVVKEYESGRCHRATKCRRQSRVTDESVLLPSQKNAKPLVLKYLWGAFYSFQARCN